MNGITFGQYLKKQRKKVGKPSKELAKEVGKGVTYVSHLERGAIKKPDFEACFNMLKILGVDETRIEGILEHFGIVSPEHEQSILKWASEEADKIMDFDWVDDTIQTLQKENDRIHQVLTRFIQKDPSGAKKLIIHQEALIESKEGINFLVRLFEHDFSRVSLEDRNELLSMVNSYILTKYQYDKWGELERKEV